MNAVCRARVNNLRRDDGAEQYHVVIQGDLVEIVHVKKIEQLFRGGRRQMCRGFTPSSRLRMLKYLATVRWADTGKPLLVTLTYPDVKAMRSAEDRTRDRGCFMKWVERCTERQVPVIWRLEWQERKSGVNKGLFCPHFHLVVFGVPFLPHAAIRSAWRNVLGHEGPLATDVRKVDDAKRACMYVGKYLAKVGPSISLDNASYLAVRGRSWGILRPRLIPRARTVLVTNLSTRQLEILRNYAATKIPNFDRDASQGFCVFGELPEGVSAALARSEIDSVWETS